jgi:hypothetical protein
MRHGRRRWGRRLVATVLVLVLLGVAVVAADGVLRRGAERVVAERIDARSRAASTEVRIPGTLAGIRMLDGRVGRIEVAVREVPVDDAPVAIDRIDLELTGVRIHLADLQGGGELPAMEVARFEARIDAATVRELLVDPLDVAGLELVDGGVALRVGPAVVQSAVRPAGGRVELVPDVPLLGSVGALTVDLSDQFGSPYVDEVRTDAAAMVVRGYLAGVPVA